MKIAIAGTVYVGLSNALLFAQHNEDWKIDSDPISSDPISSLSTENPAGHFAIKSEMSRVRHTHHYHCVYDFYGRAKHD